MGSRDTATLLRDLARVYARQQRVAAACAGFSATQCHVLTALRTRPGESARTLAGALGMDKAAVSRAVRSLAEAELIAGTRDPRDGRSVRLELTEAGRARAEALHGALDAHALRVLERVPVARRQDVVRSLEALLAAVGDPEAAAGRAGGAGGAAGPAAGPPAIRAARAEDWEAVAGLLRAAGLPLDGAREATLLVAAGDDGLAGCAGVEEYGEAALLRSVAVRPDAGGQGLAAALVVAALEEAAARGARDGYLLTTTAAKFFPRFGFAAVERAALPVALQASAELAGACPDTAVAMAARLRQPLAWVRRAATGDIPAIARIHNEGIADRVATLDEEPHSEAERAAWLQDRDARHPVLAAVAGGRVCGWASLNAFNPRAAYRHVADISVYVERRSRGTGVGSLLVGELIRRATDIGYHKLVLSAFPFNAPGMALYRKHGFAAVGIYHEQGTLDGRWVDTIVMERLL